MSMLRRAFLALFFSTMAATAWSTERTLKGPEITALISGKEIVGEWMGVPYRQQFLPNGIAIAFPEGRREVVGQWRVDEDAGRYQSLWYPDDWTNYAVTEDNGQYYWMHPKGPQPFRIIDFR